MSFKKISILVALVISVVFPGESRCYRRNFPVFDRIKNASSSNNCFCFDPQSQMKVSETIHPGGQNLERLIIFLYRDPDTKLIKMYTPRVDKQQRIPDLALESGDQLIGVSAESIQNIFNSNPNRITMNLLANSDVKKTSPNHYEIFNPIQIYEADVPTMPIKYVDNYAFFGDSSNGPIVGPPILPELGLTIHGSASQQFVGPPIVSKLRHSVTGSIHGFPSLFGKKSNIQFVGTPLLPGSGLSVHGSRSLSDKEISKQFVGPPVLEKSGLSNHGSQSLSDKEISKQFEEPSIIPNSGLSIQRSPSLSEKEISKQFVGPPILPKSGLSIHGSQSLSDKEISKQFVGPPILPKSGLSIHGSSWSDKESSRQFVGPPILPVLGLTISGSHTLNVLGNEQRRMNNYAYQDEQTILPHSSIISNKSIDSTPEFPVPTRVEFDATYNNPYQNELNILPNSPLIPGKDEFHIEVNENSNEPTTNTEMNVNVEGGNDMYRPTLPIDKIDNVFYNFDNKDGKNIEESTDIFVAPIAQPMDEDLNVINNIDQHKGTQPYFKYESNDISNGRTTFNSWFKEQMENFNYIEEPIDMEAALKSILKILHDNAMYVTAEGELTDSYGTTLDIYNLNLRPILIGNTLSFDSMLDGSGKQDAALPSHLIYLHAVLVSVLNPPKILGVMPLGKTDLPFSTLSSNTSTLKTKSTFITPSVDLMTNTLNNKNNPKDLSTDQGFLNDAVNKLQLVSDNKSSGEDPAVLVNVYNNINQKETEKAEHPNNSEESRSETIHDTNEMIEHTEHQNKDGTESESIASYVISLKGNAGQIDRASNILKSVLKLFHSSDDAVPKDNTALLINPSDNVKNSESQPEDELAGRIIPGILSRRSQAEEPSSIGRDESLDYLTGENDIGENYEDDSADFRIIGGNAATGSGTPLSNRGRSGFVA